jgi:N-acetylmuramoyl-L-alanine amidase
VFLTRETTRRFEERTAFANQKRTCFFQLRQLLALSAVTGVETFYLNFTRSRADLEVAMRENAGSNQSMHELSELVQKIALDDKIQESRDLASHVQLAVHRSASKQNPRARNRGVKKAPFVVLIGALMPSVLVEIGFLTNPAEQKLLKNPHHRQRIAESIVDGLEGYASTLSHFNLAKTNGGD